MAAEASTSSGSPDSYMGSLISLTSKSEIRYEGVLYEINTDEASIGLRNVRSFGTEGRRKDGPQVPPIDRVYEYIVFRGSDIKDLLVKSSPPVQSSLPVHNDPAIIQSHYTQAPATTSLASVNNVPSSDLSTQMSQAGLGRTPFQSNFPLYNPAGTLSVWGGPSSVTPPIASSTRPVMPLYWQGYYGPSSTLQSQQQQQQQSLLQPQPLPIPPVTQQSALSMNYPSVPSSVSQLPDLQPTLVRPLGSGTFNMQPTMLSGQSPSIVSESSTSLLPAKASVSAPPTSVSQSPSLPLVSPPPHAMDENASSLMPNQAKLISASMVTSSYNSTPEQLSGAVGASSSSLSLVTPGQFLQPGSSSTFPSSQPLQTEQKDVVLVQVSSSSLPMLDPVMSTPASVSASASASASVPISTSLESQTPLLPLPSPSNPKFNRAPAHIRYNHRGGRRGSELSNSATNYTEDFDFEAMNEKFKKDKVWGHLGKNKAKDEDEKDSQYEDDADFPKVEIKSGYKKDDFFDTLSCNSLDDGSRHGRPRFSEQRRLDTETFGEFSRYRGGRGGRGLGRGGRPWGGYYGRGYGYAGRGRGGYGSYRTT